MKIRSITKPGLLLFFLFSFFIPTRAQDSDAQSEIAIIRSEYIKQMKKDSAAYAKEGEIKSAEIVILTTVLKAKRKQAVFMLGTVLVLLVGNVIFFVMWRRSKKANHS